jgi:hypothetical protein
LILIATVLDRSYISLQGSNSLLKAMKAARFSLRVVILFGFVASQWCNGFVRNGNLKFGTKLVAPPSSGNTRRISHPIWRSPNEHVSINNAGFYPRTELAVLPDSSVLSSWALTLFSSHGQVPLWQALGLNAFLFGILRTKLLKVLTPEGFAHALALGTLTWTTLGWKGWTVCVLYLVLGSAVTKVKFAEKEKRGIAEGRGGRRGPENVW